MSDEPAFGVLCILDLWSGESQVDRQSHAFAEVSC
jgi:hypothetical protein